MNNNDWKVGDLSFEARKYLNLMERSIAAQNSFDFAILEENARYDEEDTVPFQAHMRLMINSGKLGNALKTIEDRVEMAKAAYKDGQANIINILNGQAIYRAEPMPSMSMAM